MGEGRDSGPVIAARRPLKSRATGWARLATRLLLKTRISADQVSIVGILLSLVGAWAYVAAPGQKWLLLAGALGVQLRLLCNMLDGLVAVEGGRKSPYGALFNEAPDRLEDSLFLAAFGFAAGALWLGLLAALLACVTAYLRVLGGSLGLPQDFGGPMAKPHRMAALTVGSIAAFAELSLWGTDRALAVTLWLIVAGTVFTIVGRTLRLASGLRAAQ